MLTTLVQDRIYYKIFDLSFKESSHAYSKHKANVNIEEVERNIKLILAELDAPDILILKQVHGNFVYDADRIQNIENLPVADASVTTIRNLALSVQTADCVPVLLYCEDTNVIGAAHAGWRGAKANIIANVASLMRVKGAKSIKAVVGPAIQQGSYEVDKEYYEAFVSEDNSNKGLFVGSSKLNYYMFDLPAYVMKKLQESNIEIKVNINEDTYVNPDKYPSYRRACHAGKTYYASILSTIIMK